MVHILTDTHSDLLEHKFSGGQDLPPQTYNILYTMYKKSSQTNEKSFLMVTNYKLVLGWG